MSCLLRLGWRLGISAFRRAGTLAVCGLVFTFSVMSPALAADATPGVVPHPKPSFSVAGLVPNGALGFAVDGAGDVNGDGYADVLISAARTSTVYALYGGPHGLQGSLTQPGFKVLGEGQSDQFGFAVAGIGDVNGDGFDDVAVGADGIAKVYIFHGSAQGLHGTSAQPAFSIQGGQASHFGAAVAGAGDVNGDGFDDLIVGSWGLDKVFVFHGSAQGLQGSVAQPAFSVVGEQQDDRFGFSVAGLGDVNGDGFADVAVGAPWADEVYAFYGSASGLKGNATQPGFSVLGEDQGDRFGFSVAAAGDVNGDSFADLLVGALLGDTVYAFHGSAQGLHGTSAQPGFRVLGEQQGSMFGNAVAGVGDMNADGFGDILVAAYLSDKIYGFFGSANGLRGSANQPAFYALGDVQGDHFGYSVAGAGDVNGDGLDDLLVGAEAHGSGDEGRAYLYQHFVNPMLYLPAIGR